MPTLDPILKLSQCPHCGVDTPQLDMTVNIFETVAVQTGLKRAWGVYRCARCGGVVTAASSHSGGQISEMYPSLVEIEDSITSPARDYLSQALRTIHAPAGSIMLAATAVDAMLKTYNYKDGSLFSRIDKAAKDHLITQEMARWAHEVRLDANEQRHADEEVDLPTEEDARHTVDFALALAQFLFVLPARIKRGLETSSTE